MLFIFMGQSSTGKSTVAEAIKAKYPDVKVVTGKDYIKGYKSETDAWFAFKDELKTVASQSDHTLIYIVTEVDKLDELMAIDKAICIKFSADLASVKARFKERMRGNLPAPVEQMLERQKATWDQIQVESGFNTSQEDLDSILNNLSKYF